MYETFSYIDSMFCIRYNKFQLVQQLKGMNHRIIFVVILNILFDHII